MRKTTLLSAVALSLFLATASSAQVNEKMAKQGWSMEQGRMPDWHLAQHEKLSAALAKIAPQRKGVVDAYVVVIGLDSDPVFKKETAEVLNVLQRRFGATARSIRLAAGSGIDAKDAPQGSPANLAIALASIAKKMDVNEDVLVFYSTSHGSKELGLVYRDGEEGFGMIAPARLKLLLDELNFKRRILLLSACYSGIFVPELADDNSVVVTAASSSRPSFGCTPGNDWTFFGDALINNAMRKSQPMTKAAEEATGLISMWEAKLGLQASNPQVSIGDDTAKWLTALEMQMPAAETPKVGRPAIETSFD
jgi:Peptidase C13 family